jgi:hypothetical protein
MYNCMFGCLYICKVLVTSCKTQEVVRIYLLHAIQKLTSAHVKPTAKSKQE